MTRSSLFRWSDARYQLHTMKQTPLNVSRDTLRRETLWIGKQLEPAILFRFEGYSSKKRTNKWEGRIMSR